MFAFVNYKISARGIYAFSIHNLFFDTVVVESEKYFPADAICYILRVNKCRRLIACFLLVVNKPHTARTCLKILE